MNATTQKMDAPSLRHFKRLVDPYYWQTAVLIARNGLARQYRNSFLGMLWTIFQPLSMVLVYSLIMPLIMSARAPNYPLYVLVSLTLWNFFSLTLIWSARSILSNEDVLKRCMISSTVFPVADVLKQAYVYGISFVTMYAVALCFYAKFSITLLLVPLYFIPVLIVIGAIAIAIAFLAPYLRDIGEMIWLSMSMMFWLTPVIYSYDRLPLWARNYMDWNPFFIMMRPIQLLAYDQVLPSFADTAKLLGLTLVAICVGFFIFRLCRRNYVYYL